MYIENKTKDEIKEHTSNMGDSIQRRHPPRTVFDSQPHRMTGTYLFNNNNNNNNNNNKNKNNNNN